jgi:NAD/NADP transhydrogenase alpha subunit
MDALSSMGTICGYKAVILAADTLPRIFPMLTTAAGTITPGRVFVIGAGVAGLQAIATARRLGAVTSAYDVRPATKEQVHSLGGKFVELPIEAKDAQDARGYATDQDENFYSRQRELFTKVIAENDVVISAAVIPGKKSPILITKEMVAGMAPGSVIVDLAAERGGNCELTEPGEIVVAHGVTILGSLNLASTVPYHASQMYARSGSRRRNYQGNFAHPRRGSGERPRAGILPDARAGANASADASPEGSGLAMQMDLLTSLYVFMLAAFIGFEVIRRVSPLLHTPLMSLTNALDAIAVVGAIILTGEYHATHPLLAKVLGTIAIVAATSNIVGGFLITDRMLKMFKPSGPKKS